jgi:hypothetical protein
VWSSVRIRRQCQAGNGKVADWSSEVEAVLETVAVSSPIQGRVQRTARGGATATNPAAMRHSEMARAGIEPATPRFSVVRSRLSNAAKSAGNEWIPRGAWRRASTANSALFPEIPAMGHQPSPIGRDRSGQHDPWQSSRRTPGSRRKCETGFACVSGRPWRPPLYAGAGVMRGRCRASAPVP